jgi:hypothetical protein
MADTKLSALTELNATPATGDELYIRDVSEATADESKRITVTNLVAATSGLSGVAKVWVRWEQTGAHGILASYNMTSVTDGSAVGTTDHLWNTDFSSTHYVMTCSGRDNNIPLPTADALATTGTTTGTRTNDTASLVDIDSNMIACFGDQ